MDTATPSSRPSDRQPAARNRRPAPGTSPDLVVVGSPGPATRIERALDPLSLQLRRADDVAVARAMTGPTTVGLVVVDPVPGTSLEQAVEALLHTDEHRQLPVFVVVGEDFGDERAARLYQAGVAVILQWPAEVLLLPRLVLGQLSVCAPRAGELQCDAALTEAVNARIAVSPSLGTAVRARVDRGTVLLEGEVDSLWKKHRLEHLLAHVPGVRGVIDSDVRVVTPRIPDTELAREVTNVLRSAHGVELSTVSVSAHEGRIVLAGTVGGLAESRRIARMAGHVAGVRGVESLLTVSPVDARRGRLLARRFCDALTELHPGVDVHVAVFGDVCVLSGEVSDVTHGAILAWAEAREEIHHVVDKLAVV